MLLPGDWVRVLPAGDIVSTLDRDSSLERLPFIPEMLPFCGRRFRVRLRAEKTCVYPVEIPLRRLADTVVLEGLRCDGASHGGCQLGCMLFWKERWLRKVDGPGREQGAPAVESLHLPVTRGPDPSIYFCQATELRRATAPGEPLWYPGQYLRFLRVRTFSLPQMIGMFSRPLLRSAARAFRAAARPARVRPEALALEPGEWVEVRPWREILTTLDEKNELMGLAFGGEMWGYCGRRLRVHRRVERIVSETTGVVRALRDTVALEGCLCDRYLGCARGMPLLWREGWLRRASGSRGGQGHGHPA
jgi:hypothetical protein